MTHAHLVAVVDDDPSVLRALHRLLDANGYTVESFACARDFLDALTRRRPDCLVLDVHLNGGNFERQERLVADGSGFELQDRLAADGMKIPIIFITAHNDDWTRRHLEQSGAAAYLWKPVDGQELLHAVRRAIAPDGDPGPRGTNVR